MKLTYSVIKNYILVLFMNLLLLEFVASLVVYSGYMNLSQPNYKVQPRRFFQDYNSSFGAWHPKDAKFTHRSTCFTAEYTTNSYGAKNLNLPESDNSVLLLGDSMIEGYGLDNSESINSKIENLTGRSVYNLGTSGHFGSTQYALLYEYFKDKIKHSDVVVGLFLTNDFEDDSYEFGKVVHVNRYRPYRVWEDDHYELIYFDKNKLKRERLDIQDILSSFLSSYHLLKGLYKNFYTKRYTDLAQKVPVVLDLNSGSGGEQLRLMAYNMNLIERLARRNGKGFHIVIMPQADLLKNPYTTTNEMANNKEIIKHLQNQLPNVKIVDLNTSFSGMKNPGELFHTCDSHLSKKGASLIASEIVAKLGF